MRDDVRPWTVLRNGFRRKCPHCGEGPLLEGWMTVRGSCPACGILYERSPGDTWGFWIVGDRIPVFVAIAVVYFGVAPQSMPLRIATLAALAVILVVTIP